MLFALFAGLATGLIHVLSGPDHLAAIAPLAVDEDRPHWRAGFQWGLGHTTGVLIIGALLLGFRELLPIEAISAYSERIVGIALVGVGLWGAHKATRRAHAHAHGHARTPASFLMGVLHGVAGSSHLFGVLPAVALSTRVDAVAYLGGFGIGAIAAMTAFAAAVGLIARGAGRRNLGAYRGVLYACSISALVVGGLWIVGDLPIW